MFDVFIGIDIGAISIKYAILDEKNKLIDFCYCRHYSKPRKFLKEILNNVSRIYSNYNLHIAFTGSGSMQISESLGFEFIQEVLACKKFLENSKLNIDAVIDIGGEDSKIVFLNDIFECKMNNSCASGTGTFIDQMASLLNIKPSELGKMAKISKKDYIISSRCGVFAKTNIQNLLSEGANKNDIAKSILVSIVKQTAMNLSYGKKICGNVGFVGGVFKYIPELKDIFKEKLKLENIVDIKNSNLSVAIGAAIHSKNVIPINANDLLGKAESITNLCADFSYYPPLFSDEKEKKRFYDRHKLNYKIENNLNKDDKYILGIDSGSTTTKLVLINLNGDIVYSDYANNNGEASKTAQNMLNKIYTHIKPWQILNSGITGYGESYLKEKLDISISEVETIAHLKAAQKIEKNVDSVIDAGGQDIKYIRIKNNHISKILLNESCSAGSGAFLDYFAKNAGIGINCLADKAFSSTKPYKLGTRCTVFMNSKIKQAQKDGAKIEDIIAGLCYSIVKNILEKVIKLRDTDELGKKIMLQGGTFKNHAVIRAFENISGKNVIVSKFPELMGAYGIALIAREKVNQKISNSETFDKHNIPNLFEYKRNEVFNYIPLSKEKAYRGVIGIPKVLNMYENYPFWFGFFTSLGFRVQTSDVISQSDYEKGLTSTPSESICQCAKNVNAHIQNLIDKNIKLIFYPCIPYEKFEDKKADNNFNCPVVCSYPEVVKNNLDNINLNKVTLISDFLPLGTGNFVKRIMEIKAFKKFNFKRRDIISALKNAVSENNIYRKKVQLQGEKALNFALTNGLKAICLASRPYMIDSRLSHNIDKLIQNLGIVVLSEDSICHLSNLKRPLRVCDQWTYASRLYNASNVVARMPNLSLLQIGAFGCGIDAITSEQIQEIVEDSGKVYSFIKIDETPNINSLKIRLKSLKYAMEKDTLVKNTYKYKKTKFTKKMARKHTVFCPQLHPLHTKFVQSAINSEGYNLVVLDSISDHAKELGLKYVNNDICYPATLVIGQLLEAVLSGKYDTKNITLVLSQSGCSCRDSNYVALLRRALEQLGFKNIPVLSFNYVGMEKVPGFRFTLKMNYKLMFATIYSDLLTQVFLHNKNLELYCKWEKICRDSVINPKIADLKHNIQKILNDFSKSKIKTEHKFKAAIIGETFLKYNPNGNNHLIELLENENFEVFTPSIFSFVQFMASREITSNKLLGNNFLKSKTRFLVLKVFDIVENLLKKSTSKYPQFKRFNTFNDLQKKVQTVVSVGNQSGEGWYIPAKMIDFLENGINNIICVQPFGCLSAHILAKGVANRIKHLYPKANILFLDYDSSISETNQLNRIKMFTELAKENQGSEDLQ